MKVCYTSALFDSSGYAEAARNYVLALMTQDDIDLRLQVVSFENWKTDMTSFRNKVSHLVTPRTELEDVSIVHLTPENFTRYHKQAKKNIGLTVWETDRLPDAWVAMCNQMDEIWVPCEWNVEVFKTSGVTVPVRAVPHCLDLSEFDNFESSEHIKSQINRDVFNFYSIFQWSARKNPEGLLTAYLSEFNADEKVCLTLKTYLHNNSSEDKLKVIELIRGVKARLQLKETPPVMLIHDGLSRNEILTLHAESDCFVLPHRAEGWGVPHFEAMASGNPVIATGFSGNMDFMNQQNSRLVDYNLTPVSGMDRPNYNAKMNWAEPHLDSLKSNMRDAFYSSSLVLNESDGLEGKISIQKFSIEWIGILMGKILKGKL